MTGPSCGFFWLIIAHLAGKCNLFGKKEAKFPEILALDQKQWYNVPKYVSKWVSRSRYGRTAIPFGGHRPYPFGGDGRF
jgi:hypothetical protein